MEARDFNRVRLHKTYEDDIVARNNVRRRADLGAVLDFLASSTGSLINPTNIANAFNSEKRSDVSRNTVAAYIGYLENAFLISEAKCFDLRGREYISGQQKYYFTDMGLRNARLNFHQFDRQRLLENAVYNELLVRGYSVDVGRVQVKVKNCDGKQQIKTLESDFVVHDFSRQMYIQVTQGVDDDEKLNQESASLRHIRDSFPKYILVDEDVPDHYTDNGIRVISVEDFLLSEI